MQGDLRPMLPTQKEQVEFTVPLTLKYHHAANQFRQKQADGHRAKQVYLNALAVQAVSTYLNYLGIKTDLTASHSWDLAFHTLADTADLVVPERGRLECRPVLPDADICHVPAEVWKDRIGYIAVQFDAELTAAKLLGFLPRVAAEEVPIRQFQPLDKCLDTLTDPVWIQLSQWLQSNFEAGWVAVESLLDPKPPELAMRFRRAPEVDPDRLFRMKTIELARAGDDLALLIGIASKADGEMDLVVAVEPKDCDRTLPKDLQLLILDDRDNVAMQAQGRGSPTLKFKFSGEAGERFSIRLVLGDVAVTEQFLI